MSWVQTRSGAWNEKVFFFLFSFFLRKEKPDNKTPLYEVRFRVCEGSGISFFTFHPRDRQIIPAPQGAFPFFFSPTCHENDFPTQVFTLWRCKQKLLDAFSCRLASHDKKIWLISLLFAIFDTKNAMRSEKVIFHEKQPKVNFLILDPLCEKREKWFFSQFFLFPWFKGVLKHRLGRLHWDFSLPKLRKEAFDFALADLPTTGLLIWENF
jgi:hypothetical protein